MEQENSAAMKAALDAKFGTDEALGVVFIEHPSRRVYTASDVIPENVDVESRFPDESSAVCCTNYAIQVVRGVYPRPARVVGFSNEDNPTSRVAREEIHPGGHDFAVVEGRYLVDPWVRLVACVSDQIVFDLQDPDDAKHVMDLYGPSDCWSEMLRATEEAIKYVPRPAARPSMEQRV